MSGRFTEHNGRLTLPILWEERRRIIHFSLAKNRWEKDGQLPCCFRCSGDLPRQTGKSDRLRKKTGSIIAVQTQLDRKGASFLCSPSLYIVSWSGVVCTLWRWQSGEPAWGVVLMTSLMGHSIFEPYYRHRQMQCASHLATRQSFSLYLNDQYSSVYFVLLMRSKPVLSHHNHWR